jgi:hypothetical protein
MSERPSVGIAKDDAGFIIDLNTRNMSFLKMSRILRDLGVKNNKFFLRIYDAGLSGVDPHDPKIKPEMQLRVAQEVAKNPWYYFREVIRIPVDGGVKKYELTRGNLALTWSMLNNFNILMELPRQNFKTISALCVYAWVYDFGTSNSQITFGNKSLPDSELNVSRLKKIRAALPHYLRFDDKADIDNIQSISTVKNGNTVKVMSAPNDAQAADKLGRGNTTACIWIDEIAFLKFNWIVYGAAAPAQSQAQLEAASNDKPYGKLFTTTPNQLELPQALFVRGMMDNACKFDEKMYDWSRQYVLDYVKKNSSNDFVYIKYSYKEIGRDEKWFETQCRALNNDMLLIKREILLEWTYSSDVSPFSEEQLSRLGQYECLDPHGTIVLAGHYPLTLLETPSRWDLPFPIGVDVAGGLSRDFSTIQILDPWNYRTIASFKNNKIDTKELFLVLCDLLSHMPNALLIVERNSMGKGVLDNLIHSPYERNLYFEFRRQEAEKKLIPHSRHASQGVLTKVYGMNTSSKERDRMINDILWTVVDTTPEVIVCPSVFRDIRNLERKANGKIEHRSGESDDSLFAYLIARYVLAYGKNLNKFMRWPEGSRPEGAGVAGMAARNMAAILQAANPPKAASPAWNAAVKKGLQYYNENFENNLSPAAKAIQSVLKLNASRIARPPEEKRP